MLSKDTLSHPMTSSSVNIQTYITYANHLEYTTYCRTIQARVSTRLYYEHMCGEMKRFCVGTLEVLDVLLSEELNSPAESKAIYLKTIVSQRYGHLGYGDKTTRANLR